MVNESFSTLKSIHKTPDLMAITWSKDPIRDQTHDNERPKLYPVDWRTTAPLEKETTRFKKLEKTMEKLVCHNQQILELLTNQQHPEKDMSQIREHGDDNHENEEQSQMRLFDHRSMTNGNQSPKRLIETG